MFLCTFGLKEWAVWNWMLRKKSENHLYSHTSPHYGQAAPSAPPPPPPPNFPDCSIKTCPSQQERLSSNWKFHSQGTTFVRISVGDNIGPPGWAAVPKLKFSITVLRDKAVLSQFHYLWPPPPPPHTHTQSWTHLILAWRQWRTCGKWICLLCAILLKQLIAVWQGHSAFWRLCIQTSKCDPYQSHEKKFLDHEQIVEHKYLENRHTNM